MALVLYDQHTKSPKREIENHIYFNVNSNFNIYSNDRCLPAVEHLGRQSQE